jgi:hypothetical protein
LSQLTWSASLIAAIVEQKSIKLVVSVSGPDILLFDVAVGGSVTLGKATDVAVFVDPETGLEVGDEAGRTVAPWVASGSRVLEGVLLGQRVSAGVLVKVVVTLGT